LRILFVANSSTYNENIRNGLKSVSEKDSIYIVRSFYEAQEFIENAIIRNQNLLDTIVCENKILGIRADSFLTYLKNDDKKTYSRRDFNLKEIPVVLLMDPNESKFPYINMGFSNIIERRLNDDIYRYCSTLISEVKRWRRHVLSELDNLGIRNNSGKIDYDYYLSTDRLRNISTDILSQNFRIFPRRLDYSWFYFNEREVEMAIDKFIYEVKRASRLNKKHDEKRFHKLINKFPFLIKRDNYSSHLYEPRLQYEEDRYYEPDYTLIPNFNQETDLSILEIKLPSEGFIKKTSFHPAPYSKFLNHLFQVSDYKEYLESDEYKAIITKVFGFTPSSIEFNLLIGRKEDLDYNRELLAKRMRQMNKSFINLITYDDLVEYQVKFLERNKWLSVT
jgi:hypothetical protein